MDAGTRPHVDHEIRGADRLLVVFDDDDGVADVAQVGQGLEQAFVVALVQADGGLVQDVHDADQAGADLAGEPDALALAAGEGLGAARERQIVQAHVGEKAQTGGDLLGDAGADLAAVAGQVQGLEPGECLAHRQGRDGREVAVRDQAHGAPPR